MFDTRSDGERPVELRAALVAELRAQGKILTNSVEARLLKAEFEGKLPALSICLAGLMHEAMRDLYQHNPHDRSAPRDLIERFVSWAPFRKPAIGHP